MEENMGKNKFREKIDSMKKSLKRFEEEIYNITYERDIRAKCYRTFAESAGLLCGRN